MLKILRPQEGHFMTVVNPVIMRNITIMDDLIIIIMVELHPTNMHSIISKYFHAILPVSLEDKDPYMQLLSMWYHDIRIW